MCDLLVQIIVLVHSEKFSNISSTKIIKQATVVISNTVNVIKPITTILHWEILISD